MLKEAEAGAKIGDLWIIKSIIVSFSPILDLKVAHTGFEPVISALRGQRPRPLDECAMRKLAGDPGFEPGQADSESAVLPLDESPAASKEAKAIISEKSVMPQPQSGHGIQTKAVGVTTRVRDYGS